MKAQIVDKWSEAGVLGANDQTPVDVYHQPGDLDSCDQGRVSLSHRRYRQHSKGGNVYLQICV